VRELEKQLESKNEEIFDLKKANSAFQESTSKENPKLKLKAKAKSSSSKTGGENSEEQTKASLRETDLENELSDLKAKLGKLVKERGEFDSELFEELKKNCKELEQTNKKL
jgi:hypothetical protein